MEGETKGTEQKKQQFKKEGELKQGDPKVKGNTK